MGSDTPAFQTGEENPFAFGETKVFQTDRMIHYIERISYISLVKLTAKLHLQPTKEQRQTLLDTMQEANAACDHVSEWCWENKVFGQYKIHHGTYHTIKGTFNLSAQMVVRCVAKVCDAYKQSRKTQRKFRPSGSVAYDSRILSYKGAVASIWTVVGRQKIPFVTGAHHAELLKYAQGEADLAYIKGKFYLLQTCDVPHEEEQSLEDVIGVDLGITNIASTDDGKTFAGNGLNQLRAKRQKIRSSLQSKGTKGSKRVLKRLSGRERTTTKIINHTIAKAIVAKAKAESKAIAVEDLKGIREGTNKHLRKTQRGLHNRWSFHQLQSYIAYKAKREGIPVHFVPSSYTSQTCCCCKKIGKRNGEQFSCETCGIQHADVNAAKNIRALGLLVTQPENSTLYSSFGGLHVRQG